MRRATKLSLSAVAVVAVATGITVASVTKVDKHDKQPASAAAADPIAPLNKLSAKLTALPDVTPRGDQYLYMQMHTPGTEQLSQFWLSIDGAHDGLMIRPDVAAQTNTSPNIPMPGCVAGKRAVIRGDKKLAMTEPCAPTVAFTPSLPTGEAAMTSLLESMGDGGSATKPDAQDKANAQGAYILGTLEFTYLSRGQRIALVNAAKHLPGLILKTDATDGAGRPGLGISWAPPGNVGTPTTIVLDPGTGQYMGTQGGDSVVDVKIVNSVGATQ